MEILSNCSLGEFSRKIYDESDSNYNQGTSSDTIDQFFQRFSGVVPVGKHFGDAGYSSAHYYYFTKQNAFVKTSKGVGSVQIEAYGQTEAVTLVTKTIWEEINKHKRAKESKLVQKANPDFDPLPYLK